MISTVAGTGIAGFSGDGGPAQDAELSYPSAVALDSAGNLYIADSYNNRIRKISGGIITTVAGNGSVGFSGDGGPATSATLNEPGGVAVDAAGNLYLADTFNNRIRKVFGGIITTIAGNGTAAFSGDGGLAISGTLNQPFDVTVDLAGNLYIADYANSRIRKVSGGIITTFAGTGVLALFIGFLMTSSLDKALTSAAGAGSSLAETRARAPMLFRRLAHVTRAISQRCESPLCASAAGRHVRLRPFG